MVNLKDLPQLNPTELEVMKILWDSDGLSAREVHQRLGEHMDWAYSTTRTTIDRMVRKDLIKKTEFHGLHLYTASVSRASGLARMVRDFSRHVLEISHVPVVSLFADGGSLNDEEIDELSRLLDALDSGEA